MSNHPLAEVFGFPCDNQTPQAVRCRKLRLCPFQTENANCTKDKADSPLGVCSVSYKNNIAITCPIRFRQDWIIANDAAEFFFPAGTSWTTLTEVRLNDKDGNTAGNIDIVLVAYNNRGKVIDFGGLEIQAVYISGNVRRPFESYMQNLEECTSFSWRGEKNYPRPDYLSSSRKRLVPQLLYKGGILNAWKKKIAVALDQSFYHTLPSMEAVNPTKSDIVWLVYDLFYNLDDKLYQLKKVKTVYTQFNESLDRIIKPKVGPPENLIEKLQARLNKKFENLNNGN